MTDPETPEGWRFRWAMEPRTMLDWFTGITGEPAGDTLDRPERHSCMWCRARRVLHGRKRRRPGRSMWCRSGLMPLKVETQSETD